MEQLGSTWPYHDGEMAGRIRAFDWASTPLGPIVGWPQSLKTIIDLMLGSSSMMSLVWGPEAIHLYNDSFTELLREHRVQALGRSAFETFARSRKVFEADVAAGMAGRSARLQAQRYPVLRRGRLEDAWFDVEYASIRDEAGAVAGVLWTLKETTAQHVAEQALRASETQNRLLVENWAQALWETDAAGVVVADCPSWRAYTGQTLGQLLGYGWLNAIHPDDRAYAERQWREAMAAKSFVDAEFRLRSPDGGWHWTNVRAAPVLNAEGGIEKWAGMNIDIDARKRAQDALRESEERYRSLFQRMGQGYCELELLRDEAGRAVDQRYITFNPAFERLFGIPVVVATGRLASEVFPGLEPWWHEAFDRIARGGQPERIEHVVASLSRAFEVYVYPVGPDHLTVLYEDVTQRRRADDALRQNEERQAFLLKLSDALRAELDADAIADRALKILLDHLRLDRCYLADYRLDDDRADITHQTGSGRLPLMPQTIRLSDFPEAFRIVFDQTLVIDDVLADERLSQADRENIVGLSMRALMAPTLRKGEGRPLWVIVAASAQPRHWTQGEIALGEEVAERTWMAVERARAEALQRESEERFRQFAMASAAGLWIREAETLAMEFVSPAVAAIYGVQADILLGDVRHWASMIVPEDRDGALAHLDAARRGQVAVNEFRIQRPSDGAFRWIRDTGFPLRDNGHIPRIGGIAEDITETRRLTEHRSVLLAELQHRVRNIMGMIRSTANRTAPGARNVDEYRTLLEGRLLALARVQALLTREANAGGSVRGVIESEVAAQAHHGGQFTLTGPDIHLAPKAVEVLTLAFHELTTNALKYGALSVTDGRLTVRWAMNEKRGTPWLTLDWIEEGGPSPQPPTRRGFGSELIEGRIPYELSGRGRVSITPEGARCHMEFPLEDNESILETDAPQHATIFGGMLDMTGAPDLTGRTILVVEDDYFLASDTAAALRGAGADILGPCPSEETTRDLLEEEVPTHAVLDLNLGGGGPRFEIAQWLKARGVPLIFLTGYDPDVIPEDLRDVVRLQKPVPFRDIVEAVGRL